MILDGINFVRSDKVHKKYKATIPAKLWSKHRSATTVDRVVHFGDTRYQHYKDRIGLFAKLDHNDAKRRKNYRTRHGAIMAKGGLAIEVKFSPAYFSYYYLW